MNYFLVGITFVVLTIVMVGIALLGSDRVFPARKFFENISNDGIEIEGKPSKSKALAEERVREQKSADD